MTTAAVVGVTLEELAARRGLSLASAEALLDPFLRAGIVEARDGVLVLVDRDVAFALAAEEAPPA